MKKIILFFLFALLCNFSYAQFPITQNLGAPKTLVVNKGGFQSDTTLILPTFTDTAVANQSLLVKTYPGNLIRVKDTLYFRNKTATAWVKLSTSSVNIYNSDGTLTANRTVSLGNRTLSFLSNNNTIENLNINPSTEVSSFGGGTTQVKVSYGDDVISLYADTTKIEGHLNIIDGTQANGYVLTSSATGAASWQPSSSADSSLFATHYYVDSSIASIPPQTTPTLQQAFDANPTAGTQINAHGNNYNIDSVGLDANVNYKDIGGVAISGYGLYGGDFWAYTYNSDPKGTSIYTHADSVELNYVDYNDLSTSTSFTVKQNALYVNKNFGINTATPDSSLHLIGGLKLDMPSKGAGKVLTSDADGAATWQNVTASGYVPYTGATQDVDLGTHILNAQSLGVKGTNGNGHIDLRHQASDASATGQTTALFADANGDLKYKNDGNYYTTLKTSSNTADRVYTFPNATTTLLGSGDTASLSTRINAKQDTSTSWKTGGNFNVNAGQFIGSINNASLRFKTNNTESMVLDSLGKLKLNAFANNGTYDNALSLTNADSRAFFNLNTNSTVSQISLKANNNAVGDSMIINDSGLIAPRSNATLWLKPSQSGTYNVVANRCAGCGSGSIFSANAGTSAPVFNVSSTGATSIGAASASTSSLVDMSSISLGLLIPRMTTGNRNAISSPASQLLVSNTTTQTLDQYNGTTWNAIAGNYNRDMLAAQLMGSTIKAAPLAYFYPTSAAGMTDGRTFFNAIYVEKEITITGATFMQTVQGVYTGDNYNGIALYSYNAGTLTLVDSTTRDTEFWKTAASNTVGTWVQKTFAGGSRTLQPGLYYLLALYNSSAQTTAPSIAASNWTAYNAVNPLATNSSKLFGGVVNLVNAPPSSQAMSSWNNFSFYFALYLY